MNFKDVPMNTPAQTLLSSPAVLSWSQERLWLTDHLGLAAEEACRLLRIRVDGSLDEDALRTALKVLVRRHELLDTRFDAGEGGTRQIPVEGRDVALHHVDLSSVVEHERTASLDTWTESEIARPFDLQAGPLIRCTLVHLDTVTHVLVLAVHAIAADANSLPIMEADLGAAYAASLAMADVPMPSPGLRYADFAVWQRGWLHERRLDDDASWWKTRLEGAPALLELPLDRSRPLEHRGARGSVRSTIPAATAAGLRALATRHDTPVEAVLFAAWSSLMSRLSRQEDVVTGVTVSFRDSDPLGRTVGPFGNTLAVRVTSLDHETTAAYVRRVGVEWVSAMEKRQAPLERVVEQARPRLASGHHPLFQTTFCFDRHLDAAQARPEGWHAGEYDRAPPRMDLALCVIEQADGFVLDLRFTEALFDRISAERMLTQWFTLLDGMLADDERPIARQPLMTADERRKLLGLDGAALAEEPAEPIHRLFEAHAAAHPHAIALTFEGSSMSYGELDTRANRLAHRLIVEGAGPDELVAICVDRGLSTIVAILGVLKSGAAYIPLDSGYPDDRLAYMLEDSAPLAIVTESAFAARVHVEGKTPILLDDAAALAGYPSTTPIVAGLDASDLAYVIYTSGSTGRPKGVLIEHRHVHRLMSTTQPDFAFDASDVWTLFHSYAFDFSVWEIWGALAYGGRLVIVSADCARSPREFYALACREGVTVLNQTPGAFRRFITAQQEEGGEHSLRYVVFGGEALELHSLKPWIECNDPQSTRLVNMYGITETTVHATYRPLSRETIGSGRGSLIGRPLNDLRIYVLDGQREPVPPGVTGEMYVAGPGVARGYLHRDDLTAERFIANPFDPSRPRMYKSGDLARWQANGELEYLGRNDFQVKIRGFRIELNEIEARLVACDGVRAATVIAREDRPGDKRLVAYLIAEDGAQLATSELRHKLLEELADYMLPSAFVILPAYPLTANGKLDRDRLPPPGRASVVTRDYEAPADEVESVIAENWQALLELETVGRNDDFFELGGNSVLALPMVYGLGKRFGVEIPLRLLFSNPTVAALAAVVRGEEGASAFPNVSTVRDDGTRRPLFIVHAGLGEIGYAFTLADWIDRDIPMHGFAARGLIAGETPLTSVAEMAALYIDGMRHLQPEGPYRVAGWSAGGSISHEIAVQLEAAGDDVEFLGLIDTPREYEFPFEVAADGSNREDALAFDPVGSIMRMLPKTLPEPIVAGMRELAGRGDYETMLDRMREAGFIPQGVDNELAVRHLAYRHSMDVALYDFRPGTLRAKVTLFSANGESRWDESLGWSAVLQREQLRVVSIHGNHCSLMNEPQITRLGDAIVAALDEAEATTAAAQHRARLGEPA